MALAGIAPGLTPPSERSAAAQETMLSELPSQQNCHQQAQREPSAGEVHEEVLERMQGEVLRGLSTHPLSS